MHRRISAQTLCLLLILGATPSAILAADPTVGKTLAWIRVEDAGQSYADRPYLWLGDLDLTIAIDVAPRPGHVLEILWGRKNDKREATVTINGQTITVYGGPSYDGFRWKPIPVPEAAVQGDGYTITLRRRREKPAFLAAIRLSSSEEGPQVDPTDSSVAASHKIRLVAATPATNEAFPEMRLIWDAEPQRAIEALEDLVVEQAFLQAERNARRAAEMFYRCRRYVDGWLEQADPETGLIARNLATSRTIWNAKDSAADNYPFMVLTSALTAPELFHGRMRTMLETEIRLTNRVDRLPDTYSFTKRGFETDEVDLDAILFGGSEYVKDGLLPLTEWLGESPWRQRMLGIVDDLWKHANFETPYGMVPTSNVEVHGEMLQVLSRVYWMTGDEKYLDYAVRLGDYYLLGDQHPTRDLTSLRLRDHGCEVVSGLAELYVAVHFARPEKKKQYHDPIHAMFDRILEVGRDERGMLYDTVNPQTGEHSERICDTWGYNYNGFYAVYLVDGTKAYRNAVRKALGNLAEHLTDYDWGSSDEFADSIEGAINLYNREPVASVATWLDSEIVDMWRRQQPNGVIEGWHGDGNVARTAIMYAFWKTQGLRVEPWREDVRVGAVRHDDQIYVSLTADKPWTGTVICDQPRHRERMGLPIDYPRINQFPEWFTVEDDARYDVGDLSADTVTTYSGAELRSGIPFALAGGQERRLILRLRPADDDSQAGPAATETDP